MNLNKNKKTEKTGIGIIRVSSKRQLDGFTIETQKRVIYDICEKENIRLIGYKKFIAMSGRDDENINSYMTKIKELIRKHDVNCLVLWKTSRLGRILPEIFVNVKELIDNYVQYIYTKNLVIDKNSFIFFENRMMLYMNFMLDEAEGYSIYERMAEGKKTKRLEKEKNKQNLGRLIL